MEKSKFPLDRVSGKRRRGRPRKIQPSWVYGRADNYRRVFGQIWDQVWPGLSTAQASQDVVNLFGDPPASTYASYFVPIANLILRVVHDRKFPKQQREAQINFLADSIGAHGVVTPRSSRDICERERARKNQVHRILSYEFYIECSCGYRGNSRNHACPMCEAQIHFKTDSPFDIGTES